MNLAEYKNEIRVGSFVRLKQKITIEDLYRCHIDLPIDGIHSIEELKTKKFVVEKIDSGLFLENIVWCWPIEYFDLVI